jgi:SAM-dependent methyltransferase
VGDVAPDDSMYRSDEKFYFYWGRSAIRVILWVLAALDKGDPKTILDLPSGHGRVLRALKATFPNAAITACDIDRDGVDFCVSMLGARPVYAAESPAETVLDDQFDLIWCGSLLTHLSATKCGELLRLFTEALSPSGILVFTTHGPRYRELIGAGSVKFAVRDDDGLVKDYDRDGFGYRDYQSQDDYGISLASPTWVARTIEALDGLRLECYAARGWGGFQDVYGCVAC